MLPDQMVLRKQFACEILASETMLISKFAKLSIRSGKFSQRKVLLVNLAYIYCDQRNEQKWDQPTKNTRNEKIIWPFHTKFPTKISTKSRILPNS